MEYTDFTAGAALLARCLCPRASYGHVLAIHTRTGCYYCQRHPCGGNTITYAPKTGSALVLCKGRKAWQQPWPPPPGVVTVQPLKYCLYYKPPRAVSYTEEELKEAIAPEYLPAVVANPVYLLHEETVVGKKDYEWLAAILRGVCRYHKALHLECEFTYNHNTRRLVWTIGTAEVLAEVRYDGTLQPRISVGGNIAADLKRYLGRSWRFGGIRVSPLFPILRPKPYIGWGR